MQWLFIISDFALEACNYLILKWIQLLSCKMTKQRSVVVDWSSWGLYLSYAYNLVFWICKGMFDCFHKSVVCFFFCERRNFNFYRRVEPLL